MIIINLLTFSYLQICYNYGVKKHFTYTFIRMLKEKHDLALHFLSYQGVTYADIRKRYSDLLLLSPVYVGVDAWVCVLVSACVRA